MREHNKPLTRARHTWRSALLPTQHTQHQVEHEKRAQNDQAYKVDPRRLPANGVVHLQGPQTCAFMDGGRIGGGQGAFRENGNSVDKEKRAGEREEMEREVERRGVLTRSTHPEPGSARKRSRR